MRDLKRQSRGVVTSFCLNFDLSLGSKVRGQRRHESQTQPDTRHVYLFHIKQTKFNTMCEMSIMSILVCIYNYIFQFYIYICCMLLYFNDKAISCMHEVHYKHWGKYIYIRYIVGDQCFLFLCVWIINNISHVVLSLIDVLCFKSCSEGPLKEISS